MLQALALRYRPKNFNELVGQEAVSKSLIHALDENRLTHAYLFSGLRGSGKTSSARIFSKALVCEKGVSSKPCEQCASCKMANEGRHIDIIEMDAASHRGIEDIKGLIEQTKYAPAVARFKIFIIDEVHMLSTPAFNALLKTLEEPPVYVKFILATTDPLKLPATVLSRTQHFRFKQISKQNVINHLEYILNNEKIPYDSGCVELLARCGSGSLRDTLTLLDQAIIYSGGELTQCKVAEMLGLLDPNRIDEILSLVMSGDKIGLLSLINELESYDAEMIIDEIIANLKANFLSGQNYSLLLYERFFRILSQAKSMLTVSSDNGFVLSVMFFMMVEALNLKSIDEVIGEAMIDKSQAMIDENTHQISKNNTSSDTRLDLTNQKQSRPSQSIKVIQPKSQELKLYELFLAKIYDRDYSLGECFERCNKFDSLKNDELVLKYEASNTDKDFLRSHWKIIQELLKASFGPKIRIKTLLVQKENLNQNVSQLAQNELTDKSQTSQDVDKSLNNQDFGEIKTKVENLASQNLIEPSAPQSSVELSVASSELTPKLTAKTQSNDLKFAPDFESMRDDTNDFAIAYGSKDEISLDFLDDELKNLGVKNNEIIDQKSDLSNNEEQVLSKDQDVEILNQTKQISIKERLMQNVSRDNEEASVLRNKAILKEANRLFGEPIVKSLFDEETNELN